MNTTPATTTSPTFRHAVEVRASAEEVMKAFTSLTGVRAWWSPVVTGSLDPGGEFHVGFEGLDETITLFVLARHDTTVDWLVRRHTSAPDWAGSRISLTVDGDSRGALLTVTHDGVPAELVAPGWQHFLESIRGWVEDGVGRPYPWERDAALDVALRYHRAWTAGRFEDAAGIIAENLLTEVPLNSYASKAEWVAALTRFGSLVERTEMVSTLGGADEAVLLYDMHSGSFGTLRIAEHFTVAGGVITTIRHVHDTHPLR
jgi:uncharacterized protein YndB with AHSA1/START domain